VKNILLLRKNFATIVFSKSTVISRTKSSRKKKQSKYSGGRLAGDQSGS